MFTDSNNTPTSTTLILLSVSLEDTEMTLTTLDYGPFLSVLPSMASVWPEGGGARASAAQPCVLSSLGFHSP